jgi:hypothetical protein
VSCVQYRELICPTARLPTLKVLAGASKLYAYYRHGERMVENLHRDEELSWHEKAPPRWRGLFRRNHQPS